MKIGTAFSFWAFCCAFSLSLFLTTQPSLAQGAINDEVEIQILARAEYWWMRAARRRSSSRSIKSATFH
ncbi:hypothetical protein [Sinorhizobium meliloti]|uniref:hypothetical protein n=1 Tax=Rhizobium meliloti TaxID=382 RepID=UPI001F44C659|nr:hypothetical protein [Sinorhizobium meliloti]MDE4622173.1 hypothetical protein [Sinorhizobium meliloti]